MMIMALGIARVAVKQLFGYGRGQNGIPNGEFENRIVSHIVDIAKLRIVQLKSITPDDYDKCITKICRSVDTHRAYGPRGYYEFIRQYM
jgi:hypothetical protein